MTRKDPKLWLLFLSEKLWFLKEMRDETLFAFLISYIVSQGYAHDMSSYVVHDLIGGDKWHDEWQSTNRVSLYYVGINHTRDGLDAICLGEQGCVPTTDQCLDADAGWQGIFVQNLTLNSAHTYMLIIDGAVVPNDSAGPRNKGALLACPVIFAKTPVLSGSDQWTRLASGCRSSLIQIPNDGEQHTSPAIAVFRALEEQTRSSDQGLRRALCAFQCRATAVTRFLWLRRYRLGVMFGPSSRPGDLFRVTRFQVRRLPAGPSDVDGGVMPIRGCPVPRAFRSTPAGIPQAGSWEF